MSQLLKPFPEDLDAEDVNGIPSTPGKFKLEKSAPFAFRRNLRFQSSFYKLAFWSAVIISAILFFFLRPSPSSSSPSFFTIHASYGGRSWEKLVRSSTRTKRPNAPTVLVTGAAGFVGSHVSAALKRRGDGVLGLDNFNDYYEPSLKRARQLQLQKSVGVYIVEGDINDAALLAKLFDVVPFTHVLHLAAQAGVRYALQNPSSYVQSNVAGLVNLFEACRMANPQPAIVWASSSSVYGLNTKVPFSESDRTDQPASLYAATKKAGEEIAHTYNHIHGLSITGLRFFTVYGPWGRPDMAYFFFTRDILKGKSIPIFEDADHGAVARDFTYIDDIVKGCLASLDTAKKSTGSGGKKRGPAQLRTFNLGNTSPAPVTELVNILEKLLKVKAKRKVMKLPRNGDVPFTHANISLAQEELGYRPTTDLQTGLKNFVKWYLDYYKNSSRKRRAGSSFGF
ncbi:UDP-glucuronate 4-epimerase 2 [Nymphaea thermarum]|nr:UDP-glucuronate 4-epimerase 2 [Nymphaea thermarum]